MTKVWYHRINGQAAVFEISENMSSWPDYQETNPFLTQEQKVRSKRDLLLSKSDTMALADRITDEWRTYRQSLRDLPAAEGFPDVNFPTPPS